MRGTAWKALPLCVLVVWACGRGPSNGRIVASGHVEATEVRVAPKVGGRLERLLVDEGDAATAGQILATIDTVEKHLSVVAARADRDMAASALRLLENGARKEDVAAARARVEGAEADRDGARKDLERLDALFQKGAAPEKARDDARVRSDMSEADLKAAREELKRLVAGSRAEDVETARARVRSQDARLALLEQELEDATIESPVSGVVSEKLVEAGEMVSAGTPVVVVTDLADAWLTAFIGETDLGRIRLGQPAEVVSDDGQKRPGRVTFIASRAEFTPRNVQTRDERVKLVYEIKVSMDNRDGLFKPGMPAEAILSAGAAADTATGRRP